MYILDQVKVGKLVYYKNLNRFLFEIIKVEDSYLKRLNYSINENSGYKDKIVYVNHKIICIRNNDKLVYGSLVMQPLPNKNLLDFEFEVNIHMKLLKTFYNFKFFSVQYVTECLKMDRKYWIYDLIAQAIKNYEEKGNWVVEFSPGVMSSRFSISQKEFLENSGFGSDFEFLSQFNDIIEKVSDPVKSEQLACIYDIIQDFNSKTQSFDIPSKIFYIHCSENKNDDPKLRSDIIFCAGISDQQDFLFQTFLKTTNPMNFPSWDDMKKYGIVYWYSDINQIKEKLDKGAMMRYKQKKDVFEVLFWFVLLGKHKLLVPLFKLEKGQERFVNFFSMDFNDPKNVEKAVNNAYVLKSQKKFELSAAFFILARHYIEAIDLLITYSNNMQLSVLIYRLNETAIMQNEASCKVFMELIETKFIQNGEDRHDYFLIAIGHMILKNYESMIKAVSKYKQLDKISCIRAMDENEAFFGFYSCNYSPYYLKILKFIESSPSLKRFVISEDNSADNLIHNFYKTTMMYYMNQNSLYQCLETLVEFKTVDAKSYEEFKSENLQLIESCLSKIALKKMKSLVQKKSIWKIDKSLEHMRAWFEFFNLDFDKLLHNISHRIYLINNTQISLFFHLNYKLGNEVGGIFKECLKHLLHRCAKLFRIDMLSYHNQYKFLKSTNSVKSIIVMLNDLYLVTENKYTASYVEHRADFSEVLMFYFFLIMLKAQNWSECLNYIERYTAIDVFDESFKSSMKQLEEWISAKYYFHGKHKILEFDDKAISYTNLNLICTVFLQNMLFYTFVRIRSIYAVRNNIVDEKLGNLIHTFEAELKNNFVNLLSSHEVDQQIDIIDELQSIFTIDMATLKQQTFSLLNPKEAFDIDRNPRIHSKFLKTEVWFDLLYELKLQKILDVPLRGINDHLLEQKTAFFKNGIELFKIKSEPGINIFNKGIITDISIFQTNRIPDVYILVQNKIRKIYLFNSLFKKLRAEDGYTLNFMDDLSSISVVNEAPLMEEESHVNEKPAFYRLLHKFLFNTSKIIDSNSMKILEVMLDLKEQKRDNIALVDAMTNHRNLQILSVASVNRFYLLSAKTLATLNKIEIPNIKKIKFIITDHSGYKLVLIDHNKNAFVVKYNLAFTEISVLASLLDKNIYHATFFENSTKIIFTTYSTKIYVYDFIGQEHKEIETNENLYIKNRVVYAYMINKLVLINMKKNCITTMNTDDYSKEDWIENGNVAITAFTLGHTKQFLVTGLANGSIMIFDLKILKCLYQKSFESFDNKKIRVDSLALLNDFVIAAFSNGVLSIVFKI